MSFSETETRPVVVSPLNDPEMHYIYYEGDMMIQESDEKKVAMYTAKRWPHGRIPYIMENKFSDEERAAIARGMMILQERTCIRFLPKQASDHDYVLMKRGPGCAAHVGKIGGQQWVILGDGCYSLETVTHELMHSVGFIHEQSRPDRDEHVEIVWNNIKPNAKRNFKKHEFDYLADHGFPYDLMSVMHYRQYAFSKNRKPTIVPKRPVPYLRCRGLDCPSELDIEKINFLYKCYKKDDFEDNFIDTNDDDNDDDFNDDLGFERRKTSHLSKYQSRLRPHKKSPYRFHQPQRERYPFAQYHIRKLSFNENLMDSGPNAELIMDQLPNYDHYKRKLNKVRSYRWITDRADENLQDEDSIDYGKNLGDQTPYGSYKLQSNYRNLHHRHVEHHPNNQHLDVRFAHQYSQ
ncbi:Zinc metalloproteinase nas-8 [Sarcoptes scabiei]|uniref:Metalloendopeptidase n=1 Tax=Sarcoptes scabiei TaxID=52283 RepID=A0A834RA80_SARSC|nr:Zinc metalloproteinase nas-8 [Sarcoptes scabiei]